MTKRFGLCCIAAVFTCPPCAGSRAWHRAVQSTTIHRVDFRNFSYRPVCLDWDMGEKGETIKTRDGSFSRKRADDEVKFAVTDIIVVVSTNGSSDYKLEVAVR